MSYMDVMVVAVPEARKADYMVYARNLHPIFREAGATAVVDSWGEDVPVGKLTDFRKAVQATDGEGVAVGWITWPDRAARDKAWEKLMTDGRMNPADMPFDGKRMIFAGFTLFAQS